MKKNYTTLSLFLPLFFYAISCFSQSSLESKANLDLSAVCGTCDLKPGDVSKFKDALTESKLHYYTDNGKTKLDLKKANEECNLNYFYICNDKLVLTSSGMAKDRTELRQKKKLSLNDYSKMFFDGIITNTPKSNERKGVTIGQIHSSADGVKRPLLRVEVDGGKEIKVVVTDSYVKGEGVVHKDFLVPFKDGDRLTCAIEIKKSGNKIGVEVANKTNGKKKKRTYNVSELWQSKDGFFYFKAGAYTQVSGPKTRVSYDEFKYDY